MPRKKTKKRANKSTAPSTSATMDDATFHDRFLDIFSQPPKKKRSRSRANVIVKGETGRDVFSVPSVLSPQECMACIRLADQRGFKMSSHKATKWIAFRRNGRIACESPRLAAMLWPRLKPFFDDGLLGGDGLVATGLNSNFRLYRYEAPGDAFGQHIDESVVTDTGATQFTVLFYLTTASKPLVSDGEASWPGMSAHARSPLAGGHTDFFAGDHAGKGNVVASIPPEAGKALMHVHGERCMLHAGAQVTRGVKYLLRTDVVFSEK